jgi:hypothetical protein
MEQEPTKEEAERRAQEIARRMLTTQKKPKAAPANRKMSSPKKPGRKAKEV